MINDSSEFGHPCAKASGADHVVLVVEEEALLRNTTAEFLRLSGFTVIEVQTAAEAIAELKSGASIDVVLSDVRLSGPIDGLELAQWLRQQYADVPILLTSGYGGLLRQAALDLVGDEFFLSKPYRQECLADRIRRLLEASSEVVQMAASASSKR
jgi:CheY-like chemotaxis protein